MKVNLPWTGAEAAAAAAAGTAVAAGAEQPCGQRLNALPRPARLDDRPSWSVPTQTHLALPLPLSLPLPRVRLTHRGYDMGSP